MGEIDQYEEGIVMANAVPMDNFKALLEEARTIRRQRDELAKWVREVPQCVWGKGYKLNAILAEIDGETKEPAHPNPGEPPPRTKVKEAKKKMLLYCERCQVRFPVQPTNVCTECHKDLYDKRQAKSAQQEAVEEPKPIARQIQGSDSKFKVCKFCDCYVPARPDADRPEWWHGHFCCKNHSEKFKRWMKTVEHTEEKQKAAINKTELPR